jgi:uncharacterized membrane protein YoaK (UPF0700 family)
VFAFERPRAQSGANPAGRIIKGCGAMRKMVIAALLGFNGGFVDTAGFLGLDGLFTAHVTGNFVTLAAALVLGSHGVIGKMLALPEFVAVIALARIADRGLSNLKQPALRILLVAKVAFLLVFFLLAIFAGPFPDSDSSWALFTGFSGIAAMALQNTIQRVYLPDIAATTFMTRNTIQVVIDGVDLLEGTAPKDNALVRERFAQTARTLSVFALGCGTAALLYHWVGLWCLGISVVVGAAAAMGADREGNSEALRNPVADAIGGPSRFFSQS